MDGKKGASARRVRLEDIAEKCGVSVSTVSRALARERGVRPDLRAQIIATAKSHNYAMPSAVAGKKVILAASSAAMIDYVRNQFTTHVMEGLMTRADTLGLEIVSRSIASPTDEKGVLAEALAGEDIAGLLFLTLDDEDMLAATRGFSKPVVLVNGDDPFMRLSSVAPCNRSATRLGTDHLLGLGHRRILFLMRRGRRTIERRFEGWRDAMTETGEKELTDLVVEVEDWLPDLASTAISERLARKGLDFTAIVTAGDSLAVGAIMGLQAAGYQVPGDVSVMGMDDLPQAAFLSPPLTTIHIPMREIGAAALDLLHEELSGPSSPTRRVELACHIVERQSTGPVKA